MISKNKYGYKPGMASATSREVSKKVQNLKKPTDLIFPDSVERFDLQSDRPITIDILPYKAGDSNPFVEKGQFTYEHTYFLHKNVGPNNQRFICPKESTLGRLPCCICDYVHELQKDGGWEENKDQINQLKAKRWQLFNIIDTKNRSSGVQVWAIQYHFFGKVLVQSLSLSEEDDDIYEDGEEPEIDNELANWCEFTNGKSLRIAIEHSKFNGGDVYKATAIQFIERRRQYDPNVMLGKVHCLDRIPRIVPNEEISKVFYGGDEEESKRTSNKKSKKEKLMKQLSKMTKKELVRFIYANELDDAIDPAEFKNVKALCKAVAEEMAAKLPASAKVEEDDDLDDEEYEYEEGDDLDDEEYEEEEDEEYEDEEGDDLDDEEYEEEEEDDEEEYEDDDLDDEEYEEEEPAPKKRGRGRPATKKKATKKKTTKKKATKKKTARKRK